MCNASAKAVAASAEDRREVMAASLLQCGARTMRRRPGVRRPLISKAALILLVTCALFAPAKGQQSRARRNSYSGPVKIRVRAGETIPMLAERFNVAAVE